MTHLGGIIWGGEDRKVGGYLKEDKSEVSNKGSDSDGE